MIAQLVVFAVKHRNVELVASGSDSQLHLHHYRYHSTRRMVWCFCHRRIKFTTTAASPAECLPGQAEAPGKHQTPFCDHVNRDTKRSTNNDCYEASLEKKKRLLRENAQFGAAVRKFESYPAVSAVPIGNGGGGGRQELGNSPRHPPRANSCLIGGIYKTSRPAHPCRPI